MTGHSKIHSRVLLALVIFAGGTSPLLAQDKSRPANQPASSPQPPRQDPTGDRTQRDKDRITKDQSEHSTPDLRSCHWLSDRPVVNDNTEDVAKASDFILDRGTGRIQFAILRTGTVLGMGGKAVAVPYSALRWDASNERFVLASTPEQLKSFAEFTPESWTGVMEPGKGEPGDLAKKLIDHGPAAHDPYVGQIDAARTTRIEGEITNVDRVHSGTYGEQVEITVKTDQGPRRVALGPAWFVNGADSAPMRGDKVSIDAIGIAEGAESPLIATKVTRDSRVATLRESDGSPSWGLPSLSSGGKEYSSPRWRYVLLSDLRGAKVECRGEECGKVHDIILDRRSGQAAFLSIDPNQNFLGIADTKRIAPWSIVTVSLHGTARLDATKEMILASPQTPSDIATLNAGTAADMIYRAYQTSPPDFRQPARTSATDLPGNDAWGAKGPICASIDHASKRTITGTIADISREKFDNGVPPASVLKISEGGQTHTVVLGPAWYLDNQKLVCRDGDTVTVEACRAMIDGREHWIASSLVCKGNRVVLVEGGRNPAWDRK